MEGASPDFRLVQTVPLVEPDASVADDFFIDSSTAHLHLDLPSEAPFLAPLPTTTLAPRPTSTSTSRAQQQRPLPPEYSTAPGRPGKVPRTSAGGRNASASRFANPTLLPLVSPLASSSTAAAAAVSPSTIASSASSSVTSTSSPTLSPGRHSPMPPPPTSLSMASVPDSSPSSSSSRMPSPGSASTATPAGSSGTPGIVVDKAMRLVNCRVLRDCAIVREDLWVQNGKFIDARARFFSGRHCIDVPIDCHDLIVAPGFIDIQTHGAFGVDFSSAPEVLAANLAGVAQRLLQYGVTSFCPTIMSCDAATYAQILPVISLVKRRAPPGAEILGVHLEGPFLNMEAAGDHNLRFIATLENGLISVFRAYGGGALEDVRIVTLAPETIGAMAIIPELRARGAVVAAGHSLATASLTEQAVQRGITLVTSMFHSTHSLSRDPGLAGVLGSLASRPFYTLVADGLSCHPTVINIAHRAHPSGAILVTDSIAAMGVDPGLHKIGDVEVHVRPDRRAVIAGTDIVAGSTTPLDQCVRNFRQFTECTAGAALESASLHPARLLRMADRKGSLSPGCDADFLFLDDALNVVATYVKGELAWVKPGAHSR